MESITKKSRIRTFKNYLIGIGIIAVSFGVYVHDSGWFEGMEGFSGFSSLRVAIWVVSKDILNLAGWTIAFINSKGKSYRFTMLVPLIMISFQLGIYLFDARNTTTNEFTTKTIVHFSVALLITTAYYFFKRKYGKAD